MYRSWEIELDGLGSGQRRSQSAQQSGAWKQTNKIPMTNYSDGKIDQAPASKEVPVNVTIASAKVGPFA